MANHVLHHFHYTIITAIISYVNDCYKDKTLNELETLVEDNVLDYYYYYCDVRVWLRKHASILLAAIQSVFRCLIET